jgi:hypothetical protein
VAGEIPGLTKEPFPPEEVKMFKNWSKVVLVSMLVLMVAASMSFATTSRVRSLAGTGDYMSDDSNAMRWYSVLPMYANQVNVEVGTTGNTPDGFSDTYFIDDGGTRAFSVNYACGEDGKWGTYRLSLNENTLDSPGLWSTNMLFMTMLPGSAFRAFGASVPSALPATAPLNKWDVGGGWEIGDNASVGVSLTRSSWNYEDPDVSVNQSFTSVGIGGTWSNNEDMTLDGTFTWGMANGDANFATSPVGGTDPYTAEWDSKNAIEIAGRMFWDWKDDVTLVPVASFASSNYSLTDNQDNATVGYVDVPGTGDKMKDFKAGVGLNMDVNTDNMLIVAAEFRYLKWEYSNADTVGAAISELTARMLPTIRMALETKVTSWMTTRVGAAKHLGEVKEKDVNGDEYKAEPGVPGLDMSSFDWTLGVGFDVAEWTVDLELDSGAPFSTFYWVTGYSYYDTNSYYGPVTRISGVYNF